MPGLNTNVVVYRLPVKPEHKPIKQKLRHIRPKWTMKFNEELIKQLDAGFLEVIQYLGWLANVVPIPKKDRKARMCVDYRDLNNVGPKDDFTFPHISALVNSTHVIRFSLLWTVSLRIIKLRTYYCIVIHFGLKNAGPTYQRAMTALRCLRKWKFM